MLRKHVCNTHINILTVLDFLIVKKNVKAVNLLLLINSFYIFEYICEFMRPTQKQISWVSKYVTYPINHNN